MAGPIAEHEVRPLPHVHEVGVFSSRRSAVWAQLDSLFGPVGVTCTHLNSIAHQGANRAEQMVEVLDLVQSRQRTERSGMPAIVCGDMNATEQ